VVRVKSTEQRAMLTLHRVRQGFVVERTATGNRVRALLTEFGLVLPQGLSNLRRGIPQCVDTLPDIAQRAARDLYGHLKVLDERIAEYDRELVRLARMDETTRRVQTIPGIGPITASAVVATIGSAHEFRNGREFVSWLGLVPRQWSTGGKTRLGHISRWGDVYRRHLLVMGARAVLQMAGKHDDRLSRWAISVKQRRGHNRAMVALAAKNARILWAVLSKGEPFQVARAAA
jgi:transposase